MVRQQRLFGIDTANLLPAIQLSQTVTGLIQIVIDAPAPFGQLFTCLPAQQPCSLEMETIQRRLLPGEFREHGRFRYPATRRWRIDQLCSPLIQAKPQTRNILKIPQKPIPEGSQQHFREIATQLVLCGSVLFQGQKGVVQLSAPQTLQETIQAIAFIFKKTGGISIIVDGLANITHSLQDIGQRQFGLLYGQMARIFTVEFFQDYSGLCQLVGIDGDPGPAKHRLVGIQPLIRYRFQHLARIFVAPFVGSGKTVHRRFSISGFRTGILLIEQQITKNRI